MYSNAGTTMLLSKDGTKFIDTRRVTYFEIERMFEDLHGTYSSEIRGYIGVKNCVVLAVYDDNDVAETAERSLCTAITDSSVGAFSWLPDTVKKKK